MFRLDDRHFYPRSGCVRYVFSFIPIRFLCILWVCRYGYIRKKRVLPDVFAICFETLSLVGLERQDIPRLVRLTFHVFLVHGSTGSAYPTDKSGEGCPPVRCVFQAHVLPYREVPFLGVSLAGGSFPVSAGGSFPAHCYLVASIYESPFRGF